MRLSISYQYQVGSRSVPISMAKVWISTQGEHQ